MHKNRFRLIAGLASAAALSLAAGLGVDRSRAAPPPAGNAAVAKPAAAPGAGDAHADARVATVNAFLNKHCVSCHGPTKHKADLVLHTLGDQPALLAGRKIVQNAVKQVKAGEMPPEDKPQPTSDEIEAFTAALGGIYADADKNAKPDPGRVTVRRLNRTEYNNTVRDLLGVMFTPADDFPADDIGHGFDNVGDVLTVSPVLMERYLTAAEAVASGTIAVDPPKLKRRYIDAQNMVPRAGRVEMVGQFRQVTSGQPGITWRVEFAGPYTFKARVYGRSAGGEPARAALMVDGKTVGTFDVVGTDEKSAKPIEQAVSFDDAGEHVFAIAIANPSSNAAAAAEADVAAAMKRRREREAARANGTDKAVNADKPANGDKPADGGKKEGDKPNADGAKDADGPRAVFVDHLELSAPTDTRPMAQRRLLALADANAPRPEQTKQILTKLVSRAYRRPATPDEVGRLAKLVADTEAGGEKWEAGLQLALQAILVSPKFLFRLELDDRPEAPDARPLDDYALASRLSYFLWASMPDDELFDLAAKKQLSVNLEPQVRRMLKDPKAKSLVDGFAMQWLQLKRLKAFNPDTKLFPGFDDQLKASMAKETELFLGAIIKEDHSVLDLIDADFTFLDERLARHYGIADTNGNWVNQKPDRPAGQRIPRNEFVRVSLPKGGARGGILTQASVLAVTSNPTRTSPVKRGKWVLEQILGAPPPPPPPDVPELDSAGGSHKAASLRVRLEEHRANPACANCHAKMDPIGFAFENFDAVGAFRQKDGGFDIDAAGKMPDGSSFNGAGELRAMLIDKRKDQFARTIAEKLMIYALGRGLEHYDDRSVDAVSKATADGDYKFSRLVAEIVKSDPFRMRRGLTAAAGDAAEKAASASATP
ncbi:MAG: hypothetical protein JWO31_2417 [Phycisphaerales bacterium]|nr:hypothetical protein [Phycisphaerales bacterium]